MTRPTFTPGPWSHDGLGVITATVAGKRRQVASVLGDAAMHDERAEIQPQLVRDASADLIAKAPEMIEALLGLVYWHDVRLGYAATGGQAEPSVDDPLWDNARAILASVYGNKPVYIPKLEFLRLEFTVADK